MKKNLILRAAILAAAVITPLAAGMILPGCAEKTKTTDPLEGYNIWFDKSNGPAEILTVVDVRVRYGGGYSDYYYEKGAIKVLQGIVNRDQPKLYLIFRDEDEFWLQNMLERGYIKGVDRALETIEELLEKYRSYIKGAVLIEDELSFGAMIAMPVAACENLIPVDVFMQKRMNLDIKIDLKAMNFKTNAEGLAWAWDTYKDQLNQSLFIVMHRDLYAGFDGSIDYIVSQKGFPIWITEASAPQRNGTDHQAEYEVVERIFRESPDMGKVMGFWWHGESIGIGELPGVEFTNNYGKVMLVCGFQNISVHSGIRKAEVKLPEPKKVDSIENKLYVSIVTTDGDALNAWVYDVPTHTFPDWFRSANYDTVSMGWGMGAAMIDVAPAIAEWYWEKANENNEFFCDVSGLSYLNPRHFGTKLSDERREKLWEDFFNLTNEYNERNDYSVVRVLTRVRADYEVYDMYRDKLRGVHSLFVDWGNTWFPPTALKDGALKTGDLSVFPAMTDWIKGGEGIEGLISQVLALNEERKATMDGAPAFAHVFANLWYYNDMSDMKLLMDTVSAQTGGEVVFLTPSGLDSAYNAFLAQNG